MSEKLGWFKFYPGDWSRDLEEHPPEIEGYWIRICCKLSWEPERGRAMKSLEQWARVMRVIDLQEARRVIAYLQDARIADVQGDPWQDGSAIAIMSRRMVRDERERKSNAVRQERHRRKKAALAYGDDPLPDEPNAASNPPGNGNANASEDVGITPESQESEKSKDLFPLAPATAKRTGRAKRAPKLATALGDEEHQLHGLAIWFEETLWLSYPPRRGRKAGKAEAWEWLARAGPDTGKLNRIEAVLREDLASADWRRGIGIKDCHRWLKANEKNGWESTRAVSANQQGEDPYEGLDD